MISIRNIAISCLLLLTAFCFSANAADTVASREIISFNGACVDCLYSWTAEMDGMIFAEGSSRDFSFQAPNVSAEEVMKTITVRMLVRSKKGGCINQKISSITVSAQPPTGVSGISLDKGCIFSSPVLPGDNVTYTYNVTNIGDSPLREVNVKDSHDWGPGCIPVYVGGDNGNMLLDPAETWRYEAAFTVPDPDLYIKLTTMGAEPTPTATVRKMEKLRIRLTIMMNKLKELRARFNLSAANLSLKTERNITYYNYTSRSGEMLVLQRKGNETQLTEYSEPVSGGLLTTKLGRKIKSSSTPIYHAKLGNF